MDPAECIGAPAWLVPEQRDAIRRAKIAPRPAGASRADLGVGHGRAMERGPAPAASGVRGVPERSISGIAPNKDWMRALLRRRRSAKWK
jgi:hypothetical protein